MRTAIALLALVAAVACAADPLVDLFEATGGRSWHRNDGWLGSGHHCTWYGVACNADSEVTGLFLSSNNLRGTIPVVLPNITTIIVIEMEANALMGSLPDNFGQLVKLQALNLRFNQLSGRLPSGLSSLKYLEVDYNQFSGDLTPLAASVPTLQVVSATANRINGTPPTTTGVVSSAPSLSVLQLGSNEIEGDIARVELPASVEVVDLSRNKLTGHMPRNFRNSPKLRELLLFGNGIRGPIASAYPDTLGVLDLHGNRARGQVPAQLATVAYMEILHLQQNELGGMLPEDFASPTALDIDLSGNKFLCPLPVLPQQAKADCTKLLLHRAIPDYAPLNGGGDTVIQLEGFFSGVRGLNCKFGAVNSPATIVDDKSISCPIPKRNRPGTVELSVTLSGIRISNNTIPFSYASRKRQIVVNPNATIPPVIVVVAGTSKSAETVALYSAMAPVEQALGAASSEPIMAVEPAWVAVEDPEYPTGVWSRHGQLEAATNALVSCYMLQVSAFRGIVLPPCLFVNTTNPDPRTMPPCAFEKRSYADAALTWARMRSCAHSGLGKGYLLDGVRKARELGATDTSLYVNGKQLCAGNCGLSSSDIIRAVCDAYDGEKPAACA